MILIIFNKLEVVMKLFFRVSFLVLLMVIPGLVFSATAQEIANQAPAEQVNEYSDNSPDSEAAIITRFADMPDDWSTDALVKAVQNVKFK